MMRRLDGKVAIVTGGGTGIGEAISKKFALEGAKVVVAGDNEDPVIEVAESIKAAGGEAFAFKGDLSLEANADAVVKDTLRIFGRIDILINNAGKFPITEETQDFPYADFNTLIKDNIASCFSMTRACLPYLQESRGNIVSAGSEAGFNGLANMTPYGGTKAFIHSFMKGIAVEQAKYGVRANCVCPGPVDTAMTNTSASPLTDEMEEMIVDATPMARRGTTEEIANIYAFLASDEASYVTGALWLVDGGITVGKGAVGKQTPSDISKQPKGVLNLEYQHAGRPTTPA